MLSSFNGSFEFGKRYVPAVAPTDPGLGGLVAWFDPSYLNTGYIEISDYDILGAGVSTQVPGVMTIADRTNQYVGVVNLSDGKPPPAYATGYNFLKFSEKLNQTYQQSGITVSENAVAAPNIGSIFDGTVTADLMATGSSTGQKFFVDRTLNNSSSVSFNGQTVTYSLYAKTKGAPFNKIGIGVTKGLTFVSAMYDLSTGTVGGTFDNPNNPGGTVTAPVSATMQAIGADGWYRISFTVTWRATESSELYYNVYFIQNDSANTITPTGDSTMGYYIWGRQVEISATPGPYCRTFTSGLPVSGIQKPMLVWELDRPTDVLFSYLSSGYYNLNQGTLLSITSTMGIPLARNFSIVSLFRKPTTSSSIRILGDTTYNNLQGFEWTSSGIKIGLNRDESPIQFSGTDNRTGYFISSSVMNSSTVSLWLNGSQVGLAQSAPADPTGQTFEILGQSATNGALGDVLIYNKELTTDERQRAEGYLAHKWGQQALLDVSHPYKAAAPTPAWLPQ